MDSARIFLNDTGASLFNNSVLTPYVAKANETLEVLLITWGIQAQRQKSIAILVPASLLTNSTLILPDDFLVPRDIYERAVGQNDSDYTQVIEKDWEPDSIATNTLNYYAFRNNNIYFPPCSADREVQVRYERQLAVIVGENSPADFILAKNYLAAKTAELAARYIGMNGSHADDLLAREVGPAEYNLSVVYIGVAQALPKRRRRYQTRRLTVS